MKAYQLISLALVILLLAAGVSLWATFQQDMSEARERLVGRSDTIETAHGNVEYGEAGTGAPVLVIHGSGGGFDQGLEFTGPLTGYGYRLIAPSRFGYLGSTMPDDASPELQADAFAMLLDRIGIHELPVFGGSAGALSAMQFAIRHPERCSALILLVPAAYSPAREPGTNAVDGPLAEGAFRAVLGSDFLFWAGVRFAPNFMTRAILATDPALVAAAPPDEQIYAQQVLRHVLPIRERAQGLWFDTRTAGAPPAYDLDRISCPVLAISAEDDFFGTAESARHTAAHVPNGRAIIYPAGGHLLIGHSEEVWREIASFIETTSRAERYRPAKGHMLVPGRLEIEHQSH